ncbi:MAG: hypothetical protein GY861_18205 [bacterium]|nr:hypothetical protein [bacterium]
MDNLNLTIDSQNLEQCLKTIANFGGNTYQNICTGEMIKVPWGTLGWGLGIIMSGLLVLLIIFLVGIIIKIARE